MNNNAFKDLVRARIGSTSSKAIARKAVEEEFRKKKRKRPGGGGDLSSSDEEDDHQSSYKKKGKRQEEDESEEGNGDDAEAIQKDLSTRYRDRAKERREGKLAASTSTDENIAAAADLGASNSLLIVPHNIKGLDLALVRKERLELQTKSGGGNRKLTTTTNTTTTDKEDKESTSKIKYIDETRDEMPTLDQATQILQDFLSTDNGKNVNDIYNGDSLPVILSNGLVEYLSEILSWKTLDISTWEGGPTATAAASKSLQHTKFALAIDGNPSDPTRAWEIPRQYTLSQGGGSGGVASSSALLPTDVMNKINAVFRNQNSIREEMMERQTSKAGNRWTRIDLKKETPTIAGKDNDNDFNAGAGGDDDESDDDMFGGLDD
jgi:hypothetical protein